jgi:hypothetical protein
MICILEMCGSCAYSVAIYMVMFPAFFPYVYNIHHVCASAREDPHSVA